MVNLLKELELTNIVPDDIPEDVVQVDILYTESNSPEIYKGDSVRKDSTNDTYWDDDKYVISEENIYSLIEEKQLLRQWDNVPKKALAQEIIGNRLVYGNYEQNYDLDNHYELITYDKNIHKSSFTFPELPYKLKKLIISTCMKYDTGAYSLINDFRNLADEEGIVYKKSRDLLGKNLDKSVSSLYTDDYVILIHNNIIKNYLD